MSALVAVVIPCLDEEEGLAATCHSLGFGDGAVRADDSFLILVDNGSVDGTADVAMRIRDASLPGTVILAKEKERGYVPPRRRGNALAMELAQTRGVPIDRVLIVQADADTNYSSGYAESMRRTATEAGAGVMIEARSGWSEKFVAEHGGYIQLCDEVDSSFESLLGGGPDDVVVDDKACAYWLSDYEMWGGHCREYVAAGDEILSETTRLYIRARSHGASRHLCDEAITLHSSRRIVSEPALSFATAGFPREAGFRTAWSHHYQGPNDLMQFSARENRPQISLAITSRQAHLRALFELLPLHVHRTIECNPGTPLLHVGMGRMPQRDLQVARRMPGVLLEDVFAQIDGNLFKPNHADPARQVSGEAAREAEAEGGNA